MTKYRVFPEDNSNPTQEGDEKADEKVNSMFEAPSVGPSIVAATTSTPISTISSRSFTLEMGLGASGTTQNALNTSSISPATKIPLKSTLFTKLKDGILKSNAINRNESKRDVSAYSNSSVPATNTSLNPSVIVNIPVSSPVLNPKIADIVDTEVEEPFWLFKDDLGPELRTINAPETGMNSAMVTSRISAPLSLFRDWLFPKNEKQEKKEVEMAETGKAALDPQASKVPFNNLEEEIKSFLPQIHVVRLLDRFVLFHREEEANLFKEIRKYQKKIPSATRTDAFETFGSKKFGEALIRIAFDENMDQFMTYRNFDYFGKNLEKYRYQFFEKMIQQDLILILDVADVYSDRRREICICCPFDRLVEEAHDIKLYFPLTTSQIAKHIKQFDTRIKPADPRWIRLSNTYRYTAQCHVKRSTIFDKNKISHFQGGLDPPEQLYENFFSPMQRTLLIQYIINKIYVTRESIYTAQTSQSNEKKTEQNASDLLKTWFISDLLSKNLITRWVPLHAKQLTDLRIRYKYFFKSIGPVKIRNYFGEEIAFYFAWVQFYTEWCLVICIPGLAAVGWGFAFSGLDYSTISLSKFLSLFDNSSTILFAFSLNLCSILFAKFWKRRNHLLSFLWDVDHLVSQEENQEVRNGWVPSKKLIYSPINGEMIPYESEGSKVSRRIFSFLGIMSCIIGLALVIAANVALQSYTENIGSFGLGFIDQFGRIGNSAFASVVSAIAIVFLSFIFDLIVLRLIKFENHRTLQAHLTHYIWVQFLLQFINSYGLLIFTAVMRPIFFKISPNISYIFGPLSCDNQGAGDTCMKSLVLSVSVTFVIQNFILQLIGWISLVYHNSKMKLAESQAKSFHQLDKRMLEITSETFEQVYNSRIVQFGYLVLFSSAFPFGPLLALFNNLFQGKLNGNQYLYSYCRPFVVRSNGIGSWETISASLVILGIIVNGLSLPFISDGFYYATNFMYEKKYLDQAHYQFHQVLFVMIYEHLLLLCYMLVETLIADIPECVRVGRLAEKHILKARMISNSEEGARNDQDNGMAETLRELK